MLGECFDPQAELFVQDARRPHWSQAGAIVFVTFRTLDSIPQCVLERWEREKTEWLLKAGVLQTGMHWRHAVEKLSEADRRRFNRTFNRCREVYLDKCHGDCVLRSSSLSQLVANSLMHFDGSRYHMGDFVIMPNHVHLLASFATPDVLRTQCSSWLRYTARCINRQLGRRGRFWQQEPFDHLVRSNTQYEYLRQYIRDNPVKANLQPGEFHYRRHPDEG